MKSVSCIAFIAVAILFFGLSCAPKKKESPPLDAYEILGSTAEKLIERLGPPTQYSEGRLIRWKNSHGVRVFARITHGKVSYVAYTFEEMEPFDEARAFAMIGVEPPKEGGENIGETRARRWSPFGKYEKLTLSPRTKLISIGKDPVRKPLP